VRPAAEADVIVRIAADVEAVRLGERDLVAISRIVRTVGTCRLRDCLAADLGVPQVAVRRMKITGEAQRTISSTALGATPSKSALQARRSSGKSLSGPHAVTDGVARRLVAGPRPAR